MRTSKFGSSSLTGLTLILLAGCSGDYAAADAEPGVTESAGALALSADLNETSDGLERVAPRQAVLQLGSGTPASDDATLSPRAAAARHGTHFSKTFEQRSAGGSTTPRACTWSTWTCPS